MMRKFFVSLLLGAGFALADVCTEFCGSCKDAAAGDEMCARVLAMCSCEAPPEEPVPEPPAQAEEPGYYGSEPSAQAEEEPGYYGSEPSEPIEGSASVSEAVSSLGNTLYEAAMSGQLGAKVLLSGGAVGRVDLEKVEGSSLAEDPQFSELSETCAEFCRASAGLDPSDPMVELTEKSCGCSARLADSLKFEELKGARLENAKLAADSVLKACPQQEVCLVSVTLKPDDFSVASLKRLGMNRAEKRRSALGDALYEAAVAGKLGTKIVFMGDSLAEFVGSAIPGVAEVPEPRLEPFSSECVEFCRASAELDPSDPMVELTEKSCGCSARAADSLKVEAFKNVRLENAKLAADSVVNFCSEADICRLQLKLKPEDFALDSIKVDESEELQKLKLARIEALKKALYENCFEGVCKVNVKLTKTGTAEVSANAKGKIKEPEPKVEPLSDKCVEFCAALPADSASPMFKQIEGICGCVAHERDSLALMDFRAKRDSNALAAATQIAELCYEKKTCEVEAVLNKKTFALASYNVAGETAIAVAGNSDEEKAKPETDGVKGKSTAFGVLAYGGGFSAEYDLGDYGLKWDADGGFEVGLGGFFRWYFYKYGSLQTGLNVAYSYIDLGNDTYGEYTASTDSGDVDVHLFEYGLKEHKFSAEVPLQVRVGVPFVYATFLFTVRKPLWEYLIYEGSTLAVSGSSAKWRGFDTWEFLGHVGGGLEFGRRLSLEALFGLFDLGTASDYVEQDFSWRIKADFAF